MQAKGGLMTRRTFAGLLGGAAAFAGRGLDAQPAVPTHVHDLYERSIAIDCLASPQSFNIPWPPQDQGLLDDQRANIHNCGITAINLTVNGATFEETTAHIAFWMGEMERDPSLLTIVRNAADIQAAKQSKRLALMFGFQGTDVLGTDLTKLVHFRRLRRAHHAAHLQHPQPRRRRLSRTGQRGPEFVRTANGGPHE
jgi:membrane dipeptidase